MPGVFSALKDRIAVMVFSSPIFLFLFLPVVLTIYFLIRKDLRNFYLLLISVAFYTWGEKQFILVMIASAVFNYIFALIIGILQKTQSGKPVKTKVVLLLAIVFNVGLLGFWKYTHFLVVNLNAFLHAMGLGYAITVSAIHTPIGISFFTFRALSYIIDVYDYRVVYSKSLLDVILYLSFFPLSMAGPIVRYGEMAAQLVKQHVTVETFSTGITRFIIGMGKKCLIANTLASVVDPIFTLSPGKITFEVAWLGIICYTLQIYFDFSGYSDMAIGLGRMFGFEFLENFNYPYISQSVREFWRRWHISLSTWFRDYLFIPLGGSRTGHSRVNINLMTVFFCCGLWHGASWNFVLWGLWYGLFLVLERHRFGNLVNSLWRPLRHLYVLLVVILGWVLFRSETLSYALAYFQAMAGLAKGSRMEYPLLIFLNRKVAMTLCAGVLFSGPVPSFVEKLRATALTRYDTPPFKLLNKGISISYLIALAFIFLSSAMSLASGTHNPFIYFRF
jgi:alginate O-acetyltransferase complex protein AlgI